MKTNDNTFGADRFFITYSVDNKAQLTDPILYVFRDIRMCVKERERERERERGREKYSRTREESVRWVNTRVQGLLVYPLVKCV